MGSILQTWREEIRAGLITDSGASTLVPVISRQSTKPGRLQEVSLGLGGGEQASSQPRSLEIWEGPTLLASPDLLAQLQLQRP